MKRFTKHAGTYTYAAVTDKGERSVNEDSFGVASVGNDCCYIVCDGVGGHGMGEMASNTVKEVFTDRFRITSKDGNFIPETFEIAQLVLEKEQNENLTGNKMKTTAVVLTVVDGAVSAGHIGDSRLYVFKNNGIVYQTVDHSVPQMLVMSGQIRQDELRHHPERNKLVRAMGTVWNKPQYEIERIDPGGDYDAFLLCSDGFWEYIEEDMMCSLLTRSRSAKDWLEKMHAAVKVNGKGHNLDNNTAIAIKKV